MSPGKGVAIRFGVASKGANPADALKSPLLPPVDSTSTSQASQKAKFYKPKPGGLSQIPEEQPKGASTDIIAVVDEGGASKEKPQEEIVDNFGMTDKNEQYTFFEGECFLKTRADRFKTHWAVIMGNELYCYRKKDDPLHRVMHSLSGTFIKDLPEEACQSQNLVLWPVKIVLPQQVPRPLLHQQRGTTQVESPPQAIGGVREPVRLLQPERHAGPGPVRAGEARDAQEDRPAGRH